MTSNKSSIMRQGRVFRQLMEKNIPMLRGIFFRLQGASEVAYCTYSASDATQKTEKKTSKMGYSFLEIALGT